MKLWLGSRLDLFGDEAFYWQCARRLDLGFTDHPPMTALLVRLGIGLLGDTPLGVRLACLLLGGAIPLATFLLARALAGTHDAWIALGLSLALPGLAGMGVLAVPDVPLLAFYALALVGLERATRTGGYAAWIATGALCALGLATQYRFALFLLGALLYLLLTPRGRGCFARPPLYLAALLAALGVLPVALFNLRLDFAPLRYQLLERHGGFSIASALRFPFEQALIVSPPLWLALLAVLVRLGRRARAGDDRAALLWFSSVAFLGAFALASPWSDRKHAHMHWPLPGYLPLLAVLPSLLRDLVRSGGSGRRWLAAAVPGVGAIALAGLALQFGTAAPGPAAFLMRPFSGWGEVRERAWSSLEALGDPAPGRPVVLADHFIVAAELEFALGAQADIYVLDHRKNREYGRALQYELWNRGERALRERAGEDALVVLDESSLRRAEVPAWNRRVAGLFEALEPLSRLGTREGRRRMLYLAGRGIRGEGEASGPDH